MKETRGVIPAVVIAICMFLGSAHAGAASCKPISSPESNAGLEKIKTNLMHKKAYEAYAGFQVSEEAKKQNSELFLRTLGEGEDPVECVTIKRVRQSPYWISEIVMYRSGTNIIYVTAYGQTDGDNFEMVNFSFSTEFSNIENLLH